MDRTVTFAQAKNQFADLLDRVIYRNERITITKRGKPVATISGMDDVEQRERAKDRERVKRIREIKKRTKKYIPFEQVVRDYERKWGVNLGLDLTGDSNVRDWGSSRSCPSNSGIASQALQNRFVAGIRAANESATSRLHDD